MKRYLGIDIGAETIKVAELTREATALQWTRRLIAEHHKDPGPTLLAILADFEWRTVTGAAVSGRLSRQALLPRVPTKQAQGQAFRFLHGNDEGTIVSIGSHGFSVLELRSSGVEMFRENSRCSQGTGNFLRQLVERFDLSIEEASQLCAEVTDPAPLSGRCPVILKTDMTHLANKGVSRARILAGLYDAVCENVQVQIKPRISPPRVVLVGGVSRSRRIRENFRRFLVRHGMSFIDSGEQDIPFFEALGSAVVAAARSESVPSLENLLQKPEGAHLDRIPALTGSLGRVRRMPTRSTPEAKPESGDLILGFDIGSTGSKVVALDSISYEPVFDSYVRTSGDPIGASQSLMKRFAEGKAGQRKVVGIGVTGSGREIVGSLMTICYGSGSVFVVNEIAAHAQGALHHDNRVDTIFEIGGQDAKYIRLAEGRVVDAAMNEACSAGTGSFIEEQGRKFSGITGIEQLGEQALLADSGVSLGQHCSVFMAEIIDEAVATGIPQPSIIAGIYDSVVQNYLNRVKGSRSIGKVIFCQGMPFSADALAAAVARQTGCEVVIPPSPGTVGALGISLLAKRHLSGEQTTVIDPARFLEAKVSSRDTFVCKSTAGCGGSGNKCRIDRLSTVLDGRTGQFTWGGGCSLYDKGARTHKLPALTPDPFRERQALIDDLVASRPKRPSAPKIALAESFQLKGIFPFFATFFSELGFELSVSGGGDQAVLKRGIEEAHVPFCAPMQQYHGLVSRMAEEQPDYLFVPMVRSLPKVADERDAVVCPIVQASPDLLNLDLGKLETTVLSPVIDVGEGNLRSKEFLSSCHRLAGLLGLSDKPWKKAYDLGVEAQARFDEELMRLGQRALAFCQEKKLVPVVVLGRSYTIHNTVLNSNVPAILREQGALAIPIDCYPVGDELPIFRDMYWGYSQRILRAAQQIRSTPGIYSVYCSNYSCGPDSFSLHFYAHLMEGKPFAIIETDGHSGDAGTKTRIEAFLHCVREHLSAESQGTRANSLKELEDIRPTMREVGRNGERILIPWLGHGSKVLAACFRGAGFDAENLPIPTRETLTKGRRHTSGKECLPMCVTLGSLLEKIEADSTGTAHFAFFMPTTNGPCRFGVYNLLHKLVIRKLGYEHRVRVVAPDSDGYFEGLPQGLSVQLFSGIVANDLLLGGLLHARPVETRKGAAQEVFDRYHARLIGLLEEQAKRDGSMLTALIEVTTGRLFGCAQLLREAAAEFVAISREKELPTILVTGEIYVRCDEFSNDYVIEKLEERGIRTRLTPVTEWLEYVNVWNRLEQRNGGLGARISSFIQNRILGLCYNIVREPLQWPPRTTVEQALVVAAPYVRKNLGGEAVLTVGSALHDWIEGHIDGVVSVGPLECMPNKIAESQYFHVAEREGLLSLTLPLNGDPLDPEVLDTFAFELHARFKMRHKVESISRVVRRHQGEKRHSVPAPVAAERENAIGSSSRRP